MKLHELEVLNAIDDPILVLDSDRKKIIFRNNAALMIGLDDFPKNQSEPFKIGNSTFECYEKPFNRATIIQFKDVSKVAEMEQEIVDFIRIASHDLREPARKIATFGDRLKTECENTLDAKSKMYLDRMLASSDRLQQMLHDLLSLSRVKLIDDIAEIHLEEIMEKIAREKLVELTVITSISKAFKANKTLIIHLFEMLFDNVSKFKYEEMAKAEVGIELKSSEVQITIQDNGIGMSESDFEMAKKPFVRLNGRSEYPGTGMGLAIAAKIIKTLKGKMILMSSEKGSKIRLVIPLVKL